MSAAESSRRPATDLGPVSRFVRSMPRFQLKALVFPSWSFVYIVLVEGPQRGSPNQQPTDYYQVEPGFDRLGMNNNDWRRISCAVQTANGSNGSTS